MRDFRDSARAYLDALQRAIDGVDLSILEGIAAVLWAACQERQTIYVFGNGGSAATASHMATDLAKGTLGRRGDLPSKGLKVVALNDNMALVTAWANDAGYENIFAGQIERLVEPGDVVIAISASGNSPNVLAGVDRALNGGATTIALTGFDGGRLADICHHVVVVDSHDYGVVEDAHLSIGHVLSQHLKDRLSEASKTVSGTLIASAP